MNLGGPQWEARFPGVCEACGGKIAEGALIRWDNADERTVAHVACPEDPDPDIEGDKSKVCGGCQTVHAGECW